MTSQSQPFKGFPKEGLNFLKQLSSNNNKEWFKAHKEDYQKNLQMPAQGFVEAMGKKLQTMNPNIRFDTRTNGSGSLMRIYRDIRFSKDKTPYKTAIAGMFWEGEGKKTESSSFGFHMEPDGMKLMAGMWGFPKPALLAFREGVDDEKMGAKLEKALQKVMGSGEYKISGEHYKRVPREYDSEHPRADLLRYNHLYVYPAQPIPASVVTSEKLVDAFYKHCQAMAPVQEWLVEAFKKAGV